MRRDTPPPEETDPDADPASLPAWRIVTDATALCYDYLGLTLIASFIVFLAAVILWLIVPPRLFGPSPLMQIVRLGLLSIPLYGLMMGPMRLARRMIRRDEPSLVFLFIGWWLCAPRALGIGCVNAFISVVLFGDLYYLLFRVSPTLRLLAIPFVYYLLFWSVVQVYLLVAAANDGPNSWATVLLCHVCVLMHPKTAGMVLFSVWLLIGLTALTWLPLAAFGPVWLASIGTRAAVALNQIYPSRPAE